MPLQNVSHLLIVRITDHRPWRLANRGLMASLARVQGNASAVFSGYSFVLSTRWRGRERRGWVLWTRIFRFHGGHFVSQVVFYRITLRTKSFIVQRSSTVLANVVIIIWRIVVAPVVAIIIGAIAILTARAFDLAMVMTHALIAAALAVQDAAAATRIVEHGLVE